MLIIPAIIPKSFSQIEEDLRKVKDFVNVVQLDICDGIFVKNKTWPYIRDNGEFEKLALQEIGLPFWDSIEYEVHLMIDKPELVLDRWIGAGLSSLIFQVESTGNSEDIISVLKQNELGVGISIKPSTDNLKVIPFLDKVDFLQIMGSDKLGFHNVNLENQAVEKIKFFREKFPELSIAIDIGVNRENAEELLKAGANKLVSGSAIFESGSIKENIEFFENL